MSVRSFGNPVASFRSRFGRTGKRASNEVSRFSATGGNVDTLAPGNGYIYHTFTTPGIFDVTSGGDIEILIVGAGGGTIASPACCVGHGGGGGGGILYGTIPLGVGPYSVTIGTGSAGSNGGDSIFNGLTAKGGGYGGYYTGSSTPGNPGGNGGGNISYSSPSPSSTQTPQGGLTGYGNPGGGGPVSVPGSPTEAATSGGGGGAGGAGQPGQPGPTGPGGDGGVGLQFPQFTGSLIGVPTLSPLNGYFAGGGGSGVRANYPTGYTAGSGGLGGGGAGAPQGAGGGTPGVVNSGGGGGGPSGGSGGSSTSGGSGIVIIRYLA